jgi:hypothetical protein
MLRKIFIFGFVILFLFSCGDDSINESTSSLVPFENDKFKMNIPSNWDIVKDYENSLPKPNV